MLCLGPLRVGYGVLLVLVLVLAAVLRFAGLDWDNGYYLHPDERFIVMVTTDTKWPASLGQYFDSATSPLNPYNTQHGTFVYGTFPVFLTKAIGTWLDMDVYGEIHRVGRAISAIADLGTVALAAWIARQFFGRWAGILAGFLLGTTMLHIQSAHYYTVDAISVFFATATFAAALWAWQRQSFLPFAIAGLMTGLAGASKPNFLITAAFLALPALEMLRTGGWRSLVPWLRTETGEEAEGDLPFPVIPATALALLVAFWTFRIAQPYAFRGPSIWNIMPDQRWLDDLRYWRTAQQGFIDVKSSVQWVGRTPILYILDNMVRWGMGPPLAFAALAGLAAAIVSLLRSRTWPSWWMLAMVGWSASQIVLYGLNIAQAQRYLMPVYPFLIVFAAGFLVRLAAWRWPGMQRRSLARWTSPGALTIGVTVLYTLFYAVAFTTLFVRPLSRVQASEWIYDNVPTGSTITSEYWDDALPMRLQGEDPFRYISIQLDLYGYEGPDSTKLSKLIGQLNQADYIILSSNRLIASVPRQPERYPMATAYYDMLVSGELGFDLVADFAQKPELFGISLDDRGAEETLTVYEHPYVRIFKKSDRFDAHKAWYALNEALGYGGVNYLPGDPSADQMLMSPVDQEAYARAGTWSSIFDRDSFTNAAPAVWWYLAMQVLALPAIPLAWRLLRHLPDHGYALSKTLGLLGVTWLAWFLGSLRVLAFGPFSIGLAWVAVLVAGLVAIRGQVAPMAADLRARWHWVVATEAILLGAFGGMAWIRSLNPDFWNVLRTGESPFFLAMFNAASRSPVFPPYDPWLSGGLLHFPYWGQMPWVLVGKLTGIVPSTAYTLAFAGVFALLCLNALSAAAILIARITTLRRGSTLASALVAPVGVALAGTLMLARRIGQGGWGYPPRPASWPDILGTGDMSYGAWQILTRRMEPAASLYHEAMDVQPLLRMDVPYFTFLNGDLSPATTALPFIAFTVAMAIAIATREGTRIGYLWKLEGTDVALLALAGASVGLMIATTTWGFLPTAALMLAAMLIRVGMVYGWHSLWLVVRNAAIGGAIVLGAAMVTFWPFIRGFTANGRDMLQPPALGLGDYLTLFGVPIAIVITYLAAQASGVIRGAFDEGRSGQLVTVLTLLGIVIVLVAAALLGSTTLFVLVALLLTAFAIWPHQRDAGHLMLLLLTGLGLALAVAQNVLSLPNDIDGASSAPNLGLYAWVMLGITASVVVAWVIDRMVRRRRPAIMTAGTVWLVAVLALAATTAAYPVLATMSFRHDRLAQTGRTLDATAFMVPAWFAAGSPPQEILLKEDRDAALWLMDTISGLPVILEAQTLDYQWGSRISAITGLPTVIGWNTPERMMRSGWTQLVWTRQEAVNEMLGSMGTFASIEPLLQQYDVQLIYIGPLERALFDPVAIRKFESAAEEGDLRVIYEQGAVTIYFYPGPGVG